MKKLYTRNGDLGYTKDYAENVIPKDDFLIVLGGKLDSLQSAVDLAILKTSNDEKIFLENVQKKLWQILGEIFNCHSDCLIDPVREEDIIKLEEFIDSLGEPPNKFVRFNTEESIIFNECRVRCRELESKLSKLLRDRKLRPEIYKYINRLSSLFFMMGYRRTRN